MSLHPQESNKQNNATGRYVSVRSKALRSYCLRYYLVPSLERIIIFNLNSKCNVYYIVYTELKRPSGHFSFSRLFLFKPR